jgi:hypothetical protein
MHTGPDLRLRGITKISHNRPRSVGRAKAGRPRRHIRDSGIASGSRHRRTNGLKEETMTRHALGNAARLVAALALASGAITVAGVTGASAAEPHVTAGADDVSAAWFGAEHVDVDSATNWGGWVDGNGPDSYQAIAVCKNGQTPAGVVRWAGDQRGSYVYCSTGFDFHRFAKLYA